MWALGADLELISRRETICMCVWMSSYAPRFGPSHVAGPGTKEVYIALKRTHVLGSTILLLRFGNL